MKRQMSLSKISSERPRISSDLFPPRHRYRKVEMLLPLLCFFLMIRPIAGMAESPDKVPTVGTKELVAAPIETGDKPTDLDRLIDTYREAPAHRKAQLLQQIRSRIVDEVTGEQQTTIAEIIRLKKLQAEEKRYALRHGRSVEDSKKNHRKKARSSRRCRTLQCTFNHIKRSLGDFFHKATRKRRHPVKKPRPKDVLKGRID